MIISKARELLKEIDIDHSIPLEPDKKDAVRLGSEALKRLEYARLHPFTSMYSPLPGETMPERGIR